MGEQMTHDQWQGNALAEGTHLRMENRVVYVICHVDIKRAWCVSILPCSPWQVGADKPLIEVLLLNMSPTQAKREALILLEWACAHAAALESENASLRAGVERLRGSECEGPWADCTDCGRAMVWESGAHLSWMCPHCVWRRMRDAESQLASAQGEMRERFIAAAQECARLASNPRMVHAWNEIARIIAALPLTPERREG